MNYNKPLDCQRKACPDQRGGSEAQINYKLFSISYSYVLILVLRRGDLHIIIA